MDLFQEENLTAEGNLFDSGKAEIDAVRKNPLVVSRTAMMSALDDMDPVLYDESPQDYMSALMDTKEAYESRINLLGDSQIRMEKAHKERMEEVRDLVTLAREAEGEDSTGAALAAQAAAAQDMDHKAGYSMEQRTARMIEDLGSSDPYLRALLEDNLANPSIHHKRQERATKRMMWQQAIEDIGAEDRHMARKVWDFTVDHLAAFLDEGAAVTGNVEVNGSKKAGAFAWVLPGVRQEAESFALESKSVPELAKEIPEFTESVRKAATFLGTVNKGEMVRVMGEAGVKAPTAFDKNIMNTLEWSAVIPVNKMATLTKSMISAGGRNIASDVAAAAAREATTTELSVVAKKYGMEPEEIIENLLPSASINKPVDNVVGVSQEAGEAYDRGLGVYNKLLQANGRSRLDAGEQRAMAESLDKEAKKHLGKNRPIKDVSIHWETTADGSYIPKNVVTLGKEKGGGGYITKGGAERTLKRYALDGRVFQDDSGEWFAQARLPIKEESFYTPLDIDATSVIGRYTAKNLAGANMVSDERLAGAAVQSTRFNDKTRSVFEELSYRNYGELSKKDQRHLDEILESAVDVEEPWMSPVELRHKWETKTGKVISPRAQEAYYDVRKIMDLEYYIRNSAEYKKKALQGFETVELPHKYGTGNAKVKRSLDGIPTDRLVDVTNGTRYTINNPMTPAVWDGLKKQGYVLVKMEHGVQLPDGTIVRSFVGKGKDFKVSSLAEIQIPYKAGIHRQYQGEYFSKAAKTFTQPDTGTKVLLNPHTYGVFMSKKEADTWNDTMNRAREAYKASDGDLAALARVFEGRSAYPSPKEFDEAVKAGKIDVSEPFETVRDGTQLPKYEGEYKALQFMEEAGESSLESLGRTVGRSYHSQRGERLLGFDGKVAPVLSPGEVINRGALSASKLNGYSDYVIDSPARINKQFEKYYDSARTPATGSPMARMQHAVLKDSTPQNIKTQFEAQRAIVVRTLNLPTEYDLGVQAFQRHIQEVLSGMGIKAQTAKKISELNPVQALRSFAFHSTLGLFNPSQGPLQISTSISAARMAPGIFKDPFQALASGYVMRFASAYGPKASAVFDNNPALLKAMGFSSKEEARDMMQAFHASGLLDIGSSHQLANAKPGGAIGAGRFGTKFEKLKKFSGIFFYGPEKFNQAVAFTVAWREINRELGGKLSRFDGAAMKRVFDKTETYSAQMSDASKAAWQKGPASIPTQFFTYPIRMHELMAGGKKLTRTQKAKLLSTQLVLYGSAGTFVTHEVSEHLKAKTGQTAEKGSLGYVFDRGMVDSALNMMIGGETDIAVGDRIGTGAFAGDLFREMMNTSPYGETSLVEMAFGVSGSKFTDTYDSLSTLGKYLMATNGKFGDPLNEEAVLGLTQNITSVNNGYKGYLALRYQQMYSKSGTLLDTKVTKPEAFAIMLGINNSTMQDTGAMMKYLKNDKDKIDEIAKDIRNLTVKAFNRPDKSDHYLQGLSTLQKIVDDPYLWSKAMEKAHRYNDMRAVPESIKGQFEEERATKRMVKRLQQGKDD